MMTLRKIGGALLGFLLLLAAGSLTLDALARSALEASLARTFGTEASVGSLDLEILAGRVTLDDLELANPDGFGDAPFLSLRAATLAAGLATVLRDTVEVEELTLEGLDIVLEQRGTSSNIGPILASVREAGEARSEGDQTAFRIGELSIRDVTARIRLGAGPAGEAGTTVEVPEIRMRDVGSDGRGAVPLSELAALTLRAVLDAVARESGGLPGSLRSLLRDRIGTPPGDVELRLPGADEGEDFREQAEEELGELLPGRDGGGRG